jgi:hypothetical protein
LQPFVLNDADDRWLRKNALSFAFEGFEGFDIDPLDLDRYDIDVLPKLINCVIVGEGALRKLGAQGAAGGFCVGVQNVTRRFQSMAACRSIRPSCPPPRMPIVGVNGAKE